MKKNIVKWCTMLMVPIALTSCAEQNEVLEEKNQTRTLTIVAMQGDDIQSRIAYEQKGENLHLVWKEGDQIMVKENTSDDFPMMHSEVLEFTLTDGADTPCGTFTYDGEVPSNWTEETELIAYYKSDNISNDFQGTTIDFPTNSTQTANNDMSHLIAYNHMKSEPFSYNAGGLTELQFNQLGAIMKLELNGLGGKCIKSLKLMADDDIFVQSDEGWHTTKQNFITLNLGQDNAGITLGDAEKLTAYLMLGVHADATPNGKSIKLYAFDDEEVVYEANITGGTLEAGRLYTLNKTMSEKVYWQGEGTAASPYRISTVNDLHTLKEWTTYLGKGTNGLHFQLQNDIDMEDTWVSFGGTFSGVFDGNGKTISNLKSDGKCNLFYDLSSNGVIKNLIISGSVTYDYSETGGFVRVNDGTIIGCTNLVNINGYNYCGGIADVNSGIIIACVNKGNIIASAGRSGGIVSQLTKGGKIIACYNTGVIDGGANDYIGGISSLVYEGLINACYSTGTLKGSAPGNICGETSTSPYFTCSASFANCYWSGNTYGAVGVNKNSGNTTLTNCSAASDWETAMNAMNSALESEGVEYRYELNTDEATKTTEPLKLKLIQVDGGGNGNLGDYGNNGSI